MSEREPAQAPSRQLSLWQHPNFRWLWIGQTVSGMGSAVTDLALPLTAVVLLGATPRDMGFLGIAGGLSILVWGLVAGVWIDRIRRRPLMIIAEISRGLLLGSIPLLAAFGLLSMPYLYAIAFTLGSFAVWFDIAATSFLPALIRRDQLVDGNSKLQVSSSVASITGPGLGGILIQALSAPFAIMLDAISYLVSATCLVCIRGAEATPPAAAPHHRMVGELGEGIRFVLREPSIRAMTIGSAFGSLAVRLQQVVYIIFLTRELDLSPFWIGIIVASTGVASLAGALAANRVARWIGPGPAILAGTTLGLLGMALVPLTPRLPILAIVTLICAQLLLGTGHSLYSISQLSLRQALTPDRMLGRVNATRRFVVFGVGPIGALAGGLLGEWVGLRATLGVAAATMGAALLSGLFSPLRYVREQPA